MIDRHTAIFGSLLSILVSVMTDRDRALVGILAIALQEKQVQELDQIVRVALQEEGIGDGSKYWKFTTGSEVPDGICDTVVCLLCNLVCK